jgi:CRP-like cAMP-binding protein
MVLVQINASAVTGMLQYVVLKELNVGEPLFFQGDLPDAYYCVLSGSLALYQFQDKAESKEVHKKYRLMSTETIVETRELLTPGTLGDEVATLKSGIGLGELSLLGIGNVHRACGRSIFVCSIFVTKSKFCLLLVFLKTGFRPLSPILRCVCQ